MDISAQLERLQVAKTIPEKFGRIKAAVHVNAFRVLQAIIDLLKVQLVYLRTPAKGFCFAPLSVFSAKCSRACHQKLSR